MKHIKCPRCNKNMQFTNHVYCNITSPRSGEKEMSENHKCTNHTCNVEVLCIGVHSKRVLDFVIYFDGPTHAEFYGNLASVGYKLDSEELLTEYLSDISIGKYEPKKMKIFTEKLIAFYESVKKNHCLE